MGLCSWRVTIPRTSPCMWDRNSRGDYSEISALPPLGIKLCWDIFSLESRSLLWRTHSVFFTRITLSLPLSEPQGIFLSSSSWEPVLEKISGIIFWNITTVWMPSVFSFWDSNFTCDRPFNHVTCFLCSRIFYHYVFHTSVWMFSLTYILIHLFSFDSVILGDFSFNVRHFYEKV